MTLVSHSQLLICDGLYLAGVTEGHYLFYFTADEKGLSFPHEPFVERSVGNVKPTVSETSPRYNFETDRYNG